jgi:tripartite ATP-independent transporter DctM subunit
MLEVVLLVSIGLILAGVPIAIAIGLASLVALVFVANYPLAVISQKIFEVAEHYSLLAIPLFIFAGFLMDVGGLSRRLVDAVSGIVGRVRGGLGIASVTTCGLFAGVSGSAVADAAAVGSVVIKPMKERGYSPEFAASIVASGGTIGPIIPPSIPFIIFGVATGTSIVRLFLAGVIPGLLIAFALITVTYLIAVRRNYPSEPSLLFWEAIRRIGTATPAIIMIVIIIGGIRGGIFTTTEAAVVAVVYALLIGLLFYRSLTARSIWHAMLKTCDSTAVILWLIGCASLLSWVLTIERIPDAVTAYVLSFTDDPLTVLILIAILLLAVGMLIDMAAAILMLVPVLFPLVTELGIDPVHFGVVTVVALSTGLITPPTAPTLVIAAGLANVRLERTFVAVLPFVGGMIAVLAIVVVFPSVSLWFSQ